ncbi:hypothetical protein J2Z83_003757 [Virgibacillus natechei]|uniref:Uncharacterized protein n=1 Tax=Virgibacillus natechei TaxID=1216297 RepID=A0ABS4IMF4_9BACI|nr:hypothetical protein [Virgibacillus natechei]
MKTVDTHDGFKRKHVMEQLEKVGSYENDHYT